MQLLLDRSMVDSLIVAKQQCVECAAAQTNNWVDTLLAIAMAIIALADVVLTIHIFCQNRKDSKESEYKTRKFELLQTLILNSNVNKFYKFFDEVSSQCETLKQNNDKATKNVVNKANMSSLKLYRLEFLTLTKVIDVKLYESLKSEADKLIDGITEAIFDAGINLKHEPKFDEEVTQRISKCRTDSLTMLLQIAKENV